MMTLHHSPKNRREKLPPPDSYIIDRFRALLEFGILWKKIPKLSYSKFPKSGT